MHNYLVIIYWSISNSLYYNINFFSYGQCYEMSFGEDN